MTHRLDIGGVSLARLRLERYLATARPVRLSDYIDRLLARTTQLRDAYSEADLRALLLERRSPAEELVSSLANGFVCSHLIDALRLAYLFRRHGIPRHELEEVVRPFARQLRDAVDAWRAPDRSRFLYWARRLGWEHARAETEELDEFSSGARREPKASEGGWTGFAGSGSDELDALLFACDFGEAGLPRSRLVQVDLHARVLEARIASPGLLAKALILETAADPREEAPQARLTSRLLALQEPSGGFGSHGAACLAVVGLSRVQPDLQLHSCKSS
jgi:hypothetical protein